MTHSIKELVSQAESLSGVESSTFASVLESIASFKFVKKYRGHIINDIYMLSIVSGCDVDKLAETVIIALMNKFDISKVIAFDKQQRKVILP